MPSNKPNWTVYGVSDEIKEEIKVFAVRNRVTVGEAIELIVKEWMEFKNKENQK